MKKLAFLLLLSGCGTVIEMPAPVAYPGACPEGDMKCQRNADAQTLGYIGEQEAALRLMCEDPKIKEAVGSKCNTSFDHYSSFSALY